VRAVRNWFGGVALAGAVAFGATAHAQVERAARDHAPVEHPAAEHASGEHASGETAPGEHADGEHGAGAEERAHRAEPMNWTNFRAPATRDAHGVAHPAPTPFIANLVNFAILLLLLYMALRRVINPALASRRSAVEAEIGEAQRLRAEAETIHREYTDKLARLDDVIAEMRREFREGGEAERERIVREAREKAERMQADADVAIAQELRQMREDLLREAVEAAVSGAESAIAKAIAPADQTRLVDEYLSSLENRREVAS